MAQKTAYESLLIAIKDSIKQAQIQTSQYVNSALITLYWQIGETVTQRQEVEGWGKAIVERLSADLQKEFPGQQGFSVQNLWFMRQFYITYRDNPILQQAVREIPWSHNIMIMSKLKTQREGTLYIKIQII
ncbi:MAG: DUF1016 N-terminal domain-containing protein [Microscillaceae bacterium]|jgi:predicted nuclease of restriction endonuclease-like (RecB) superfamily|nr:DUF1016 N-terminal domain-containing protein [Microscillaceae bacterium]